MATKSLRERIKEFTTEQKLVFWGSTLMVASVFFPWYSDLDAFKTGDTFLGITGPLYLAGVLLLGIGVIAASTMISRTMRDKMERIFSVIGNFYMMAAGFSAFLLLLANSVYFHPKFSMNIVIKESRLGMFIALAGVIALGMGGYMMRKQHRSYSHLDIESNYEPLIKMPERREHGSVRDNVTIEEEKQNTLI